MCYADGKAKAKIGAVVFPARAEQRQKPSGSTGEPRCPAVSMGKRGKYQPSLGKLQPQGETNPYSLVRPPEHSPASPAPGSRGGPARWCWRDGQTPAALRGGDGGREAASIPRSPPWLRLPKCFLRNACLMITGSLSYILGKHGPKAGKHHGQTHLSARRRDGESPVARINKPLSFFFRPSLQQQSSF